MDMRSSAATILAGLGLAAAACGQAQPVPSAKGPPIVAFEVPAEAGLAQGDWATGLRFPWAIAWLPDGRALVTEKGGALKLLDRSGATVATVSGVPAVATVGQGGLLDVELHPDFATNGLVYLTHAVGDPKANMTALSRGRLVGTGLRDVTELFRNPTAKTGGAHFGSRLLWLPDGTLLMSVGDGGNPNIQLNGENIRNNAQNPKAYFGKVLRVNADGSPAKGNPGVKDAGKGWDPRVWSLGHRNIQGLARDPKTGAVWATEHGAKGGDELNRIAGGGNHGWPLVTYSVEYSGKPITEERSRPGFVDPVSVWVPSIAPSGLAVYRGRAQPRLEGAVLAGGLMSRDVRVIRLGAGGRPAAETRVQVGARVRDVSVGPDGAVYVLTDEEAGRIVRLTAAK
jgi:glucose/arabinose dehydrogenase